MSISELPLPLAPLGVGDVHVYWADPNHSALPRRRSEFRSWLSDAERERETNFVFERHRREYLATRALVRTTLSRYGGIDPSEWRFSTNAHGRPAISSPEGSSLHFNLSNTSGRVVCAVALEPEIGVDIECEVDQAALLEVADQFFAVSEQAALRALPAEKQRERFLTYWTLKESYIKAVGTGLDTPLDSFWFDIGGEAIRIAFERASADDATRWHFECCRLSPVHTLSVAVASKRGVRPRIALAPCDALFSEHRSR